jgi:uncharacterized C2H2 Zn-finger protein
MMQKFHMSPIEALEQIRQSRPLCEPNDGFMHQLELYHGMNTPQDVESTPQYQRWIYQREIELSRACGQAPEAEKIRFEDEHVVAKDDGGFDMRCRRCRLVFRTFQRTEDSLTHTYNQTHTGDVTILDISSSPTRSIRLLHALLPRRALMDAARVGERRGGRKTRVPKCQMQGQCGQVCMAGYEMQLRRVDCAGDKFGKGKD